ncbi:hypothetical protein E4P41_06425 [Geodermatophilus sp. DF01-2]|uniref:hypothetical protein n=1 Tax=Geodermatophilus sp. DF01-2 TaxID=2559610 RepID=UPI0010740DAF|nr:hypothetical protein [Geodermatophilus sp. DF01_2]TFV62712.1 hypothetical protein E4P41_06425 [Geodermatophilus sp. DF01_2]
MGDGEARSSARPEAAVLAAFDLDGEPQLLAGGQGRSWLVGEVVLKPWDGTRSALQWQAGVLTRLDGRDDLRVSVPLCTVDGQWSSYGWTASRYQPGEHLPGRWHDVIAAGQRLHAALADEPKPAFLSTRTDIWSIADRVAWDELPVENHAGAEHLDRLFTARRPVDGVAQLVHGDLTGNVLFHPGLPPLIIDLSPYWRPPAFASAVVIADALVFEGAGADVVAPMLVYPAFPQYLLRALIFRAVTDHLARPHLRRPDADNPYEPAVDLVIDLAATSR